VQQGISFEPELVFADSSVTVSASNRFGELVQFHEDNGLALENIGSLPHNSVAGVYATGTHGSGYANQILSSSLKAFSFIDANGQLAGTPPDENFNACRLCLGSCGLWASVLIGVGSIYQIRQDVYL